MDTRAYRDTIGQFATGVTVVTSNVDGQLHGMTANAVSSVSLDPLLLLVCVDRGAKCYQQIEKAGAFGVNILAADQEELSNLFARSSEPSDDLGAPCQLDEHGVPLLEGCMAHFSCELHEILDGGDHGIFLGRVRAGGIDRDDAAPLLYFRGRYATTAE